MSALLYFLLWGAFFFVMMRFGCGSRVMGHSHRHAGMMPDAARTPGGEPVPAKAIDPVCGMNIATAGARTALHDGKVYYFCSQSCREKFEASPQACLTGRSNQPQKMEPRHEHQH